jgi:Type I phosphodiesterase / nucleotide pyrophosphatase
MTQAPGAGLVRYGHCALADVLPSALAALGVAGEPNALELAPAECLVVLLVDGLGWELLQENAGHAPFLAGLAARPLTAGCPTTTAASIASLGTGLPPGEHGITGYTTRLAGLAEPINWLTWRGASSGRDLTGDYPPEQVQPAATAFERAERAGVSASVVGAPALRASGLTRAVLRGAQYVPALTAADTAVRAGQTARACGGLLYCYSPDLDVIGHVYGCRSAAWRAQLELIDHGARLLADALPPGARLLVTSDHGMVDVPDAAKVDYDGLPALRDGIELVAGEARMRYLHVAAGQLDAVAARWAEILGEGAVLLTRDEAIGRGWFGPVVSDQARARIGDLIALATASVAVVRRKAESRSAALFGLHGGLSSAELLSPLLST